MCVSSGPHDLRWVAPPRNILLVKKPRDRRTSHGAKTVIECVGILAFCLQDLMLFHRSDTYAASTRKHRSSLKRRSLRSCRANSPSSSLSPKVRSYRTRSISSRLTCGSAGEKERLSENIDLVLALGGDGTVLHTSSLFDAGPVPPVLGLTLGTLGFLLPFRWSTCSPNTVLAVAHLRM